MPSFSGFAGVEWAKNAKKKQTRYSTFSGCTSASGLQTSLLSPNRHILIITEDVEGRTKKNKKHNDIFFFSFSQKPGYVLLLNSSSGFLHSRATSLFSFFKLVLVSLSIGRIVDDDIITDACVTASVSWRRGQRRDCGGVGRRSRPVNQPLRPTRPSIQYLANTVRSGLRWPRPPTTPTAAPYWLLIKKSSNFKLKIKSFFQILNSSFHLKWKRWMADCWAMWPA